MRTVNRRKLYNGVGLVGGVTLLTNTQPVSVTDYFSGGLVLVTIAMQGNEGVGNWSNISIMLDGAVINQTAGYYQAGALILITKSEIIRVPNGMHRISMQLSCSASVASAWAEISATEL